MATNLPILNPFVAPPVQQQEAAVARASSPDAVIDEIAQMINPYNSDLDATSQELEEYNEMMGEAEEDVSQVEEADKQLQKLINLDKRRRQAQLNIHKNVANYRQFVGNTAVELEGINLKHMLEMAGIRQKSVEQVAKVRGIAAVRGQIASRMKSARGA